MELTKLEAIKLLLTFNTTPTGIWRDYNYDDSPEIVKFIDNGLVCVDEEDPRKFTANKEGAAILRAHYDELCSDFIKFMASKGYDCSSKETIAWAISKYKLEGYDMGKDLCDYVIATLSNQGYITFLPKRDSEKYIIQKFF